MTEVAFLSYFPDPFGVRDPALFMVSDVGGQSISPVELSSVEVTIVTYETSTLIDELRRRGVPPPPNLIGIEDGLRLSAGVPRDEGGERLWNATRRMRRHFVSGTKFRDFESALRSRSVYPTPEEAADLLQSATEALRALWKELDESLVARGELERFHTIEMRVHSVLAHRQSSGVAVNRAAVHQLLSLADREKFGAYTRVSRALNRNATGLNFWNVSPLLGVTDAADLAGVAPERLRDSFRIAQVRSTFANDFLSFVDASADHNILRRASAGEARLYPVMECMGTVSGRITVSDPYLQQLRRRYRGIVAADEGLALSYLDFAQFEPGILAHLSQDETLINDYSAGDLYTQLSLAVFANANQRSLAKRMFLAFSYGMTEERIAQLAAAGGDEAAMAGAISRFFDRYPGLRTYRARRASDLQREGFVGSLLGNARHRRRSGELTPKEVRWAVNQPVQATASLVFKTSLIALAAEFGTSAIVLPVHDAVLMQFSPARIADSVKLAATLMIDSFRQWCPSVESRVVVGEFAGT